MNTDAMFTPNSEGIGADAAPASPQTPGEHAPQQARSLPSSDYRFYDRQVALYSEAQGYLVQGQDRRSWAAASAMAREMEALHGRRPFAVKVQPKLVVFAEECGCPTDLPDDATGYECQYSGLPPCGDEYSWLAVDVTAAAPSPAAVLEVQW